MIKKLIPLLMILLSLTIAGCKTIEYVYPDLPPAPENYIIDETQIKTITENMTNNQKIQFALFLQDITSHIDVWYEWYKAAVKACSKESE